MDTVSASLDTINVRHYGSEYAMTDYKSNSANLFLTTTFHRGAKFSAFGTLSYTMSKAEMDQVMMPDTLIMLDVYGNDDLTHQDFKFPNMDEYSNLEYTMLGFHAGFEYMFREGWSFTLDGEYYDLSDDAGGWVYGDESGSLYVIRTGVRYSF